MTVNALITTALTVIPTLTEQRSALADLFGNLPDVKQVFPRRPTSLLPVELPALLIYPTGQSRVEQRYEGHLKLIRTWIAAIYAQQVQAGLEYEAEEAAEPFMDSIPIVLALCPQIADTHGHVFMVYPVGSGAIRQIMYAGVLYAALEQQFTTEVETLVPSIQVYQET